MNKWKSNDGRVVLYQADCLELMRKKKANSIDAIVSDPPAGIEFMGKIWDHHKGGRDQWIAWLRTIMVECLRVLKPGGHMLCWSLPRTSYWTAMAIDDAGFEVRDCVYHIAGSGFPKSLNVSKSIDEHLFHRWLDEHPDEAAKYKKQMQQAKGDPKATDHVKRKFRKAAGTEREVVGRKPDPRYDSPRNTSVFSTERRGYDNGTTAGTGDAGDITAPATDAAKRWSGFGTSLKPAVEVWWLCRKPLEGNVAENILKHGVGGINVDGCRIGTTVESWPATRSFASGISGGYTEGKAKGPTQATGDLPSGRWPSHLLLSHSPGCVKRGKKKVKGKQLAAGSIGFDADREDGYVEGMGREYASPDGTETVDDWQCVDGCPVKELDRQSGEGRARGNISPTKRKSGSWFGGEGKNDGPIDGGDTGGASRFFQTFDAGFFYKSKPSRAERNEGCEGLEEKQQNSDTNIRTYNDRCATCGKKFVGSKDTICHCPPGEKITDKTVYRNQNNHPTIKAVALMQYLCRLITPPNGLILDPFAGSGSTGIAAVKEGFRFIGIELEQEYFDIAVARIKHSLKKPKGFDLGI